MPRSKDATKPAKKVRLTYCIATPSASKTKKGMNTSRNWANKSLNKSRVLMRSIRTNNAALAKKLNEVQIEVAKYEEETSRLRDSLQNAQQDNRAKEACLRDIYTLYDEIAHLIVALGKRIDDGLNGISRVNVSSYLNKSVPLNTTVSLEDVEQPMRPTESQLHENPFIRRDKIPRTPPMGNISSFVEDERMETDREQPRKSVRLETSPWGRKDLRKDKLEVEKSRKRRSDRENQFVGIKQISLISESPRTLDKSLEKKEQPRRNHPDVIVEKMLNDLMSHGIPGNMEEDTPTFPLSPSALSRTPVERRRSRSLGLSKRLSSRKSSSPQIKAPVPYQETEVLAPATPGMVPEPAGIPVLRISQQSPFCVVSEHTSQCQPIVVDKEQPVVSKPTKMKKTNPAKPKKRTDKKKRQEPKPVSEDVAKSTVQDKPSTEEISPEGKSKEDDKVVSEASTSSKTSKAQSEEPDEVAVGRTVVVEAKKPGVLKFSAPKPGEENVETKGKKPKKKTTRPTAKTKQVKQTGKETKSEKPKSVFDFSMSDTMNETTKVLPPFSEFREKNQEEVFAKPDITMVKTTKSVVDSAKPTKQTNDHPEDEKKAGPSSTNHKTRSVRQKKVRDVGNSKSVTQPLQELKQKAGDDPLNNSADLSVERLDVAAVVNANQNEEPQPSIDDEFQTKKTSTKKTKRRFARLITFDDSVEESTDPKQARLESSLPQTPTNEDRGTENNTRIPPDSTRSRRGNQVNYKEPGMNKKLRRGDPLWCRQNV